MIKYNIITNSKEDSQHSNIIPDIEFQFSLSSCTIILMKLQEFYFLKIKINLLKNKSNCTRWLWKSQKSNKINQIIMKKKMVHYDIAGRSEAAAQAEPPWESRVTDHEIDPVAGESQHTEPRTIPWSA